ncbi:photosynthetic protein synthase I (plasmid) [Alcanivorax sp. N3-2A]|nr:photosynthetic protein synthase I [Alcanivorax sp. N3-2A]ASK36947.1 photosynthetic protein synthase I [Alcanivorax sp. N3-2A]|tara:strand:- start:7346 stop:7912 length:567 start_codon:yes stop_codon:yes gene_type:complete
MQLLARFLTLCWFVGLAACEPAPPNLPVNDRLGGDFTLTDQDGRPWGLGDARGRVVILFFGYTHCPDICPATLARVAQVQRHLREQGAAGAVQPVFITFDPQRDTAQHLKAYLPWFKADIIGLTGSDADIRAVAQRYGVVFLKSGAADRYDFTHSDFIYLLDAQGRVRKLYPADFNIDEVVNDVQTLL